MHLLNLIASFGAPDCIITDNGGEYKNRIIKEFCENHNITHRFTTPYNPQQNLVC